MISTDYSRSTSAACASGHTHSSSAEPSSHVVSSTSTAPSANASPNHVHDERQFIQFMTLTIAKEHMEEPLLGTKGAPDFRGTDFTKFIQAHEDVLCRTGTDQVTDDVIESFPYYCSEMIQPSITMMNIYLSKDSA